MVLAIPSLQTSQAATGVGSFTAKVSPRTIARTSDSCSGRTRILILLSCATTRTRIPRRRSSRITCTTSPTIDYDWQGRMYIGRVRTWSSWRCRATVGLVSGGSRLTSGSSIANLALAKRTVRLYRHLHGLHSSARTTSVQFKKHHFFIACGSNYNKQIQFNGQAVWRNHLDLDFGDGRAIPARQSGSAPAGPAVLPLDPGPGLLVRVQRRHHLPADERARSSSSTIIQKPAKRNDTGRWRLNEHFYAAVDLSVHESHVRPRNYRLQHVESRGCDRSSCWAGHLIPARPSTRATTTT